MNTESHVNKENGLLNFELNHPPGIVSGLDSQGTNITCTPKQTWPKPTVLQQRGASRAPWSLLYLLLFTSSLCSPCPISSDTTSIPSEPHTLGGGKTKDVTVWGSVCVCVFCIVAVECSTYEMMQPSMKSPLFSLKGLTWIFNDEPISFICQIYSMTPFFCNAYLTVRKMTGLKQD